MVFIGDVNEKTKSYILIISTALIVLGIIVSSFLTEYSSLISSVVTTITAIIGAVELYIQFKKDKEVNQSSFMVQFYELFYQQKDVVQMLGYLKDKVNEIKMPNLKEKQNYAGMMNYLSWLRTLCSLIDRNIVSFDAVDEMFSYKFFAFLNCKEIQDVELIPYAKYYSLIYEIHQKWTAYKKLIVNILFLVKHLWIKFLTIMKL